LRPHLQLRFLQRLWLDGQQLGCGWAPKEDREGLFDSLYARHTFGEQRDHNQDQRGWTHPARRVCPSGRAPLIQASIDAPDRILRVDVVKDGKYVYTTKPDARSASLSFRGMDVKLGRPY
jgi:hypothetical protein